MGLALLIPFVFGSSVIRKIFEAEAGLSKGSWFQLHRGLNALRALAPYDCFLFDCCVQFQQRTSTCGTYRCFILTFLQVFHEILRPYLSNTADETINIGKADTVRC